MSILSAKQAVSSDGCDHCKDGTTRALQWIKNLSLAGARGVATRRGERHQVEFSTVATVLRY